LKKKKRRREVSLFTVEKEHDENGNLVSKREEGRGRGIPLLPRKGTRKGERGGVG